MPRAQVVTPSYTAPGLARVVLLALLLASLPPSSGNAVPPMGIVSADGPSAESAALQAEVWQNGHATVRAAVPRGDVPRILQEVLVQARIRQQECNQCTDQDVRTCGFALPHLAHDLLAGA